MLSRQNVRGWCLVSHANFATARVTRLRRSEFSPTRMKGVPIARKAFEAMQSTPSTSSLPHTQREGSLRGEVNFAKH